MKKRYSISKEQCTCGISELYDNVAKIMGVSDLSKVVYDCRKLSITTSMLLYGPKADLDGDGFITKGV